MGGKLIWLSNHKFYGKRSASAADDSAYKMLNVDVAPSCKEKSRLQERLGATIGAIASDYQSTPRCFT